MYLEGVLKKWKRKYGPVVGDNRQHSLHFVSDQVTLAEDGKWLHCMLQNDKYKNCGLTILLYNTEYLVAGNSGNSLMLEKGEIKHWDYYIHLGVKITNDGHSMEEFASTVNQASADIHQLNGILWSNNISWNTKICI